MDAPLKKILKAVTLELRHLLEGRYDAEGKWKPGDLEQRLAAIGVRRDRESAAVDELGHLPNEDKHARKVVDAYLQLRKEAGVPRSEAVADFVRETAYTWANRLLALRCMESRELIDEVILKKEVYGGRSLEHHRLAQRQPELCAGEDDGLFAVLENVFSEQAKRLPMLFDPQAPGVALRPSAAKLRTCIELLSLQPEALRKAGVRLGETDSQSSGDDNSSPFSTLDVFKAPDALGWAYQYWNTEEKDRVFEKVRTVKGAKIEGADIVPATQLYTESYMVQFLVQNSLGATWMSIHPKSKLFEQWDYYVRDADRARVPQKPVRELTFLDPACGSGHFLLEAFDLFYTMYEEEGELTEPEDICDAILTQNLYGIDIDARSIQIAEAALWMKAAERAFDYEGVPTNLVAAVSSHLKGPHWEEFLASFEKEPSVARVLRKFGESMEHIDELGSLARPNEDLKKIIAEEHAVWERQVREQKEANYLFPEMRKEAMSGKLAFAEITDEEFGDRLFHRARAALDAFTEQARERGEFQDQFLGNEARAGFTLLDILGQRYEVVAANPPYMGRKNMGPQLRRHVELYYSDGKGDLYAAFTSRCRGLARPSGRFAMVTLQSAFFLTTYVDLRHTLLRTCSIECLVQLGRHAFDEADPPGQPFLFSMSAGEPVDAARVTALRIGMPMPAEKQADVIREAASAQGANRFAKRHQREFLRIPDAPFVFWVSEQLLTCLSSNPRLTSLARVSQGISTGDNPRFVRFHWECPVGRGHRWRPYSNGGGYHKWFGLELQQVNWEKNGARIRAFPGSALRNMDRQLTSGATYTGLAKGKLGVRIMMPSIFSGTAPGIFPTTDSSLLPLVGYCNSRVASFFVRCLSPKGVLSEGYLSNVPLPATLPESSLADDCVTLKSLLSSCAVTEPSFAGPTQETGYSNLQEAICDSLVTRWNRAALLHTLEGLVDQAVMESLRLDTESREQVLGEVGKPAGWFPILAGYDHIPDCDLEAGHRKQLREHLSSHPKRSLSDKELRELKERLAKWYSMGFGADLTDDDASDSDNDDESEVMSHVPLPPETQIEQLALEAELHPVSISLLLQEGIAGGSSDWRCVEEEAGVLIDLFTWVVLSLLGHKWRSDDNTEHGSSKVDIDGIIPFAELPNEESLTTRIRGALARHINGNESHQLDRDVTALLRMDLDAWMSRRFFDHHISQFKKRPIAWQVQSGAFGARTTPAYACLAYFHKLDGDLIRKIRKQAEDVRKTFETEVRGIISTPVEARSDRQEQRRTHLEDAGNELQRFDESLGQLVQCGFGPDTLIPVLRQCAIDDATLALKARWLRRLSALLADTVLADWQSAATAVEIHDELHHWITQAITHLNHHCASVGIKLPKE